MVSDLFDFNNHAYRRFVETLKVSLSGLSYYPGLPYGADPQQDSLDVNGILSPGKMGVWPNRFRQKKVNVNST